jgi:hypothetical protein
MPTRSTCSPGPICARYVGLVPRCVSVGAHVCAWLWSGFQEHGITNTPLTPYIDKELLQHNHLYADGSKIEATGFQYEYPTVRGDGNAASFPVAVLLTKLTCC